MENKTYRIVFYTVVVLMLPFVNFGKAMAGQKRPDEQLGVQFLDSGAIGSPAKLEDAIGQSYAVVEYLPA